MNPRFMEKSATSWIEVKYAEAGLLAGDLGHFERPAEVLHRPAAR